MAKKISTQSPNDVLDGFLPAAERHALSQEEYIRSLEMSVSLLQREIENLRSQARPQPESLQENTDTLSLAQTARKIQSFTDSERVLSAVQDFLFSRLPLTDCSLFLIDTTSQTIAPAASTVSDVMNLAVKNLEEEGILDWALEQRKTVVIPSFTDQNQERSHVVLAPVYLRGVATGIFAALTDEDISTFQKEDLDSLTALAESAAVAIDNIRSAEMISRMNNRLHALNRQMMHSAKLASIGELAGSIAHEINNPLQILLGHIRLLENGVGDGKRRLSIIREQIFRMSDITRRLLDFSRAVPAEINPESVSVAAIVEDVFRFVGGQLQRDAIDVETVFEDKPPHIMCSKVQIEQVLLNIIINARDSMRDGGKLTVGVFNENERFAAITIADTGTGIPAEHLEKIFEPFFTTKAPGRGTGLGLSISSEIVRQHGGTISVASELGKGTTFKILLPLESTITEEQESLFQENGVDDF